MHQIEFVPKDRDRLFYDKFEYSLCLNIPHIGLARSMNDKKIRSGIKRWNLFSSWSGRTISEDKENFLLEVCGHLQNLNKDSKRLFYRDWLYLYTNNTRELEELVSKDIADHWYGQKAVLSVPRDCLLMKEPVHSYRSYFRTHLPDNDYRARLQNFFSTRKDQYRCSPSLKRALKSNHTYFLDYYFVDYNHPHDLTMLNLVAPKSIRKTLNIQAK